MADDLVPIGQVAEWFRMRVSALRYYEDEGLLTTQRRNGRRHFTAADLRRLTLVRTYIDGAMLSLDDVRALVAATPAARRLAEQRLAQLREHVDSTCAALRLLRHHIEHTEPDQLSCPDCDRELRQLVDALKGE
jgi:DNA-binding transcriptional MerR regulator